VLLLFQVVVKEKLEAHWKHCLEKESCVIIQHCCCKSKSKKCESVFIFAVLANKKCCELKKRHSARAGVVARLARERKPPLDSLQHSGMTIVVVVYRQ
jgi:hypothetical protein